MPARDVLASRLCVQIRKCIPSLKNKGFRNIVIDGSESRCSGYDLKQDNAAHYECFACRDRAAQSDVTRGVFVTNVTALFADHFAHHFEAESPLK
jgi:hypothetical protein